MSRERRPVVIGNWKMNGLKASVAELKAMMDAAGEHMPRFMATSQGDLVAAMESGAVRQDLYYRLSGATLHVPALRERVDDIAALAEHFLNRAERDGAPKRWLSSDAQDLFRAYKYDQDYFCRLIH